MIDYQRKTEISVNKIFFPFPVFYFCEQGPFWSLFYLNGK
jgi:hypothetical protein